MTQGVQDLINAIAEGDSLAIETAFNTEMASRISDRLDDMRADVAQNMFRTESVQVEELDEEAELTLEDYSVEEIEEFMQTEDFEQLDELSKSTLANYAQKAAHDVGNKMHRAGSMHVTANVKKSEGMRGLGDYYDKTSKVAHSKALTRLQGIKTATKKLAK